MNSAQLLQFLVNDLLDLFRIKNSKFSKNNTLSNIRSHITELVDMLTIQAHEKGIHLVLSFSDNVPSELTIDIQRVKQILINLIGNALKFTFEGSITITI